MKYKKKESNLSDLYVLSTNGKGYLRDGNYCYPCERGIILQGAILMRPNGTYFPGNHNTQPRLPHYVSDMKLIFLEISFDPIARIKRGKLYELGEGAQPHTLSQSSAGGIYHVSPSYSQQTTQAYQFCPFDITNGFDLRETYIIFGNSRFTTRWRILSIDADVSNEELYVIQEVNSIGSIPSLNRSAIPDHFFLEIEREYNALISDLHSSPESVIDHCRDVATSLLTAIIDKKQEDRLDLGKLISDIPDGFRIVKNSAEIINRLHPRRKPNELSKLSLRELSRVDSDFAVQCVFQIIRELKWNSK